MSYGTYDTMDIQGAVGGALSETLSARFSGLYQSRSDWVDNKYEAGPEKELGAYSTTAARLQFLWEPSDKFSGLLNLHGWDVDGTARIFRANILEQGRRIGGQVSVFSVRSSAGEDIGACWGVAVEAGRFELGWLRRERHSERSGYGGWKRIWQGSDRLGGTG